MPLIGSAYLRCSDPRQDKSIEQQRDEISRRAAADGVVIPPENWFVDEGISGRSTKKRASYLGLIKRAEAQRDAIRAKKRGFQPIDSREFSPASGYASRCINASPIDFQVPPLPHGIEILQRETHWINDAMAGRANGTLAMGGQAVAHRQVGGHLAFIKCRYVRRRRRRRRTENVLQYQYTAQDR